MFTGSIVALVTPMDAKGAVDRASLKKLIDYHVSSGTAAIVSVGTTGESATLSHEEHGDVCPAQWEKGQEGMGASPDGVAKYLSENAAKL